MTLLKQEARAHSYRLVISSQTLDRMLMDCFFVQATMSFTLCFSMSQERGLYRERDGEPLGNIVKPTSSKGGL